MKQLLQLVTFGLVLTGLTGGTTTADDKNAEKKAPKAEVVVLDDDKVASAKSGQTVEVQVQFAVVPPFPDKFEVTVGGRRVKSSVYRGQVMIGGKPVVGSGLKLVQFKAEGEGKQKVVVEYKKDDDTIKRKVELTLTK